MVKVTEYLYKHSIHAVDAIYEGVMKRTFVFTLSLAILHIPFFIEIIVLSPKLTPKKDLDNESQYSELKQEETK